MIMRRLRRLLRIVVRVLIAVAVSAAVAAAAGAAVIYLAGPGGSLSCVAPIPPAGAQPEPIPRWVIFAGSPAVIAALAGAYFALGAERVLWRLVGLVYAAGLAAATFYVVYTYLPAVCRP
jgi:hypothetical protein